MFRKALPIPVSPERNESLYATVDIPSISLTLVQDVLHPGDLHLADNSREDMNPDASVLSTSQLVLKKVHFSFLSVQGFQIDEGAGNRATYASISPPRYRSASGQPVHAVIKRKELHCRLGKGRLVVKHVNSALDHAPLTGIPVLGLPLCHPGTVLETIIDGVEAVAEMPDQWQKLSVKLLDCQINAVSSAAELVTGTVHSWIIVSRAIEEAVYKAHYRSISSYRRLVADILQLAHKEEIATDPLFLNRPTSAAVHLRSITDWKILAHVRHVLRRLRPSSREKLQEVFSSTQDPREDFRHLVSRLQEWHNWELDEMVIRRLPLIRFLFANNELPPVSQGLDAHEADSSSKGMGPTDIQLTIATSQLAVSYFEGGQCTNKLVSAPIHLHAMQNTSRMDAALLRVTFGPLRVQLDPGVLRLIIHISRVRRVFRSKLQALIPRPYAATHTREAGNKENRLTYSVPVRLSVLSESIDLSTHASGVRASFSSQGALAYVSTIARTGQPENAFDEMQLSFTADSVKLLAVSEGKSTKRASGQEPGGTLTSIGLEQLSMHATFNSITSAVMREVHLWGAMSSVRVRIPRSILKMSQL